MKSEEKNKSRWNINITIFYPIGFLIAFLFELYWIHHYPDDYILLFEIGMVLCVLGYLSLNGVYRSIRKTITRIEEQHEVIIKSQKAIYLTVKKFILSDDDILENVQPQTTPDSQSKPQLDSLIGDLIRANERLAKEVEKAVSIHSITQNNRKLAEALQEISTTEESESTTTDEEAISSQEELSPLMETKNNTLSQEEVAAMFADL